MTGPLGMGEAKQAISYVTEGVSTRRCGSDSFNVSHRVSDAWVTISRRLLSFMEHHICTAESGAELLPRGP